MTNFYGKLTISNVIYIDGKMDEWTVEGQIYEPSGAMWIDSVKVGDNIYIDNITFYGYLGKYKITSLSDSFTDWNTFSATVKWDMEDKDPIDPMPFSESIISATTSLGIPLEPEPVSVLIAPTFLTAIVNHEKSILDSLIGGKSGSGSNDYNDLINKPTFVSNITIENNQLIVEKSDGINDILKLPASSGDNNTSNIESKILLNNDCKDVGKFELLDSINNFDFLWVNLSSTFEGQKMFSQPTFLSVPTINIENKEQFKYRADLGAYLTFTFIEQNKLGITDINLVGFESIQVDKILGIKLNNKTPEQSILLHQNKKTRSMDKKLNLSIPYTMDFDFDKIQVDKFILNPGYNVKLKLNVSNKEFNHNLISNKNKLIKTKRYEINIDPIDNTEGFIGKFKLDSNKNKKIIIR